VALLNHFDTSSGITIVHYNQHFEISVVVNNVVCNVVEEKNNPLQAILGILNAQFETNKLLKKVYYVTAVQEPVGFVETIVEAVKKQFDFTIQIATDQPLYLITEGAKNYGLASTKLFLTRGDKLH